MKRIAYLAALGALLIASPLQAADAGVEAAAEGYNFSVIGNGLDRCSAWTQARKQKNAPDQAWVLGYVSALNFWFLPKDRGAARNLAEGADAEGLFTEIDTYCEAFPLKQVNDATRTVVTRLVAKWHATHPPIPAKPARGKRPQRVGAETPAR